VKPGGRLLYATCSLLPEENEDIVTAFLEERGDFQSINCQDVLAQQGIALETGESLRLLPHVHGTDGFFAAAMQRKSGTNSMQTGPITAQGNDRFLGFPS
jgi:16S rRNA (cytosine967-C5)-methyltransferase